MIRRQSMAIKRIDAEQIYSNSVERLSDRPGSASRYGRGGMTPDQVKAA